MCRFIDPAWRKGCARAAAAASDRLGDEQNGNVQIFDTAGRQEIDSRLIEEIKGLKEFLAAAGDFARGRCGHRTAGGQCCHALQ